MSRVDVWCSFYISAVSCKKKKKALKAFFFLKSPVAFCILTCNLWPSFRWGKGRYKEDQRHLPLIVSILKNSHERVLGRFSMWRKCIFYLSFIRKHTWASAGIIILYVLYGRRWEITYFFILVVRTCCGNYTLLLFIPKRNFVPPVGSFTSCAPHSFFPGKMPDLKQQQMWKLQCSITAVMYHPAVEKRRKQPQLD